MLVKQIKTVANNQNKNSQYSTPQSSKAEASIRGKGQVTSPASIDSNRL